MFFDFADFVIMLCGFLLFSNFTLVLDRMVQQQKKTQTQETTKNTNKTQKQTTNKYNICKIEKHRENLKKQKNLKKHRF
jgi:hypothetical protein